MAQKLTASRPEAHGTPESIILLVEDNNEDITLIERAFRKVMPAVSLKVLRNGEEAIAYLLGEGDFGDRERHPLPDLILLDLKIPRKSGLEVLAWIWEQPELEPIRVVVLTGSENSSDIERVRELDAYYQLKPSNFGDLVAFIETICRRWLKPGASNRRSQVSARLGSSL